MEVVCLHCGSKKQKYAYFSEINLKIYRHEKTPLFLSIGNDIFI
jgi:hypothetical protein